MPDVHELLFHLVGGIIALAVLNLVLEVLGISILGGERKPNFIVRLVMVLLVGFGIGYGVHNYVVKGDHHLVIHNAIHGQEAGKVEIEITELDCTAGQECEYELEICEDDNCTRTPICRNLCNGQIADDAMCSTDEVDEVPETEEDPALEE